MTGIIWRAPGEPAEPCPMGPRRGFTLIELMICIAILAIVMVVPLTARNSLQSLTRESDYRLALRNATRQLDELRAEPFGAVPPAVLRVPADGRVRLRDVVPDSLALSDVDGTPLATPSLQGETVEVDPALAGRQVILDYRAWLPDRQEAHTVPSRPPFVVPLVNGPALRLEAVRLATGDRQAPLQARLTEAGVEVPGSAAGRVVVVDYLGSRVRNQVSGRFLTLDLQPARGVGPVKELRIRESYGGQAMAMGLTLLKVQP